jgi:hypothetical protein
VAPVGGPMRGGGELIDSSRRIDGNESMVVRWVHEDESRGCTADEDWKGYL